MIKLFRHTWTALTRPERSRFSFLITGDILISLADIIFLAILLWIIRFYAQPISDNYLSFLPAPFRDRHSVWLIALYLILFCSKNIIAYLLAKKNYQFSGQVAVRITEQGLAKFQAASFHAYTHIDSSHHIRKISLQPFEFSQYILTGFQQIITQLCLIVSATIVILLFKPLLFLLLIVLLLPPVILLFYLSRRKLKTIKTQIRQSNELSYQYLLDALKGYVEGNLYNRNRFFKDRYVAQRRIFSQQLFESVSLQNMPSRFIEIFAVLGLFILLAVTQSLGNTDDGTLITIGAFMAAAYKIIPGIVKIINLSGQMKAYDYSIDIPESDEPNNAEETIDTAPQIKYLSLNTISFSYNGRQVINDLSASLTTGDFVGLTGNSGIGKTTLLNLLLGFLSPEKGTIHINGHSKSCEEIRKYWPSISYVQQQSFLIHDSILKNITLAEEYDARKLTDAMQAAGLENLFTSLPEGINAIITENGKNISGGQQQRIALARAFYKEADLILLDEPFNELDNNSVELILNHLRHLTKQGKIVLVVSHDKKILGHCTKVIQLQNNA